jgi:MFS family permease
VVTRIVHFLALKRNIALLLVMLVLAGTGEKLWLGFAPKYIEWLGGSVLVIGLFDALQIFLGAIYAYPGGWITDRLGERRSLLLFNTLSICGYIIVLVWSHWLAVLLGAFLFLAWSALSLPATFSVVANALDASRHTMGIGVQSMVRRVPMMVGPLVGGALIKNCGWHDGIRHALLGSIALGVLTGIFQWFMAEGRSLQIPDSLRKDGDSQSSSLQPETTASFTAVVCSFTPALRELLISDILIRFCERIPYAFVVLWAMNHGRLNAEQFSWLVTIEMITAMLCYIPVAHLADKYGRRPFVLITFGFFTLFPVTLLWADNFAWLAFAFAVRGLKEFGEPARKALIIGEARPEIQARTYGAYYLIRDCVVTTGSFLGAWLWSLSPAHNFLGAAICGALGTIWFWCFVFRTAR